MTKNDLKQIAQIVQALVKKEVSKVLTEQAQRGSINNSNDSNQLILNELKKLNNTLANKRTKTNQSNNVFASLEDPFNLNENFDDGFREPTPTKSKSSNGVKKMLSELVGDDFGEFDEEDNETPSVLDSLGTNSSMGILKNALSPKNLKSKLEAIDRTMSYESKMNNNRINSTINELDLMRD